MGINNSQIKYNNKIYNDSFSLFNNLLINKDTKAHTLVTNKNLSDSFVSQNKEKVVTDLTTALKIATITGPMSDINIKKEFDRFKDFLGNTFPLMNTKLEKEVINNHSFLYKWEGTNKNLPPILLMAHYDVVPADENKESWLQKPFSGFNDKKNIWGRGALDDKSSLISICESAESLLTSGYKPERTIYFALGHDEECGGRQGAFQIANKLKERGIRFSSVLDEGLFVTNNMFPGINKPVALIGTAQKGIANLELKTEVQGGHSSNAVEKTAITEMSNAIINLKKTKQSNEASDFIYKGAKELAKNANFPYNILYSNLKLFNPIIEKLFPQFSLLSSLSKTTINPTIFKAGEKNNVLAPSATANLNVRIAPGDTIEEVEKYIKKSINDSNINVSLTGGKRRPSLPSSDESNEYKAIADSVKNIYKNAVVIPSIMCATSDSYHFEDIADNVYRFSPLNIDKKDLRLFHGQNEKVSIENLQNMVNFYTQFIKKTTSTS